MMINRRKGLDYSEEDGKPLLGSASIPMNQILPSVNRNLNQHPEDYVEYSLKPEDTLQNLSVKFACPIASIKRLNNIISDQEFFGLINIRLPVGRLGVIQETLDALKSNERDPNDESRDNLHKEQTKTLLGNNINHTNNNPKLNKAHCFDILSQYDSNGHHSMILGAAHDTGSGDMNSCHVHSIRNHPTLQSAIEPRINDLTTPSINRVPQTSQTNKFISSSGQQAERSDSLDSIFKDLDRSVAKAKLAAESIEQKATDLVQTITESDSLQTRPDNSHLEQPSTRSIQQIEESLTDLGLSVHGLILFIFIICLIGPLAYVIYLEETAQYSKL